MRKERLYRIGVWHFAMELANSLRPLLRSTRGRAEGSSDRSEYAAAFLSGNVQESGGRVANVDTQIFTTFETFKEEPYADSGRTGCAVE